MTNRSYKVFAHITGLILFEGAFWLAVVGMAVLLRKVAPQLDVHAAHAWPALLVAPVGLLLFAAHYRWKQKRMAEAADLELSVSLWPDARPQRQVWKFLVWRTAIAMLAMGIIDPKWGTRMEEVETEGVDIMVALDVSKSMWTEDVGMARLDLAKRTIERLVQQLDGDRIGLVVFAGDAYVQAPLTLDLAAVKLFLDATTPDAIPLQGTAVGRAIALCSDSFDSESEASRVILVITDGENHEDDALARATAAVGQGIQVHAVGLASEGGGPIPNYDRYGRQQGYKSDESGQPIVSTLDERLLVAMAEAGQGTYVRAMQGFVDLDPFLSSLDGLEQGQGSTVSYTDYQHQFPLFFMVGLVLLLVEGVWPTRKTALWMATLLLPLLLSSEGAAQDNRRGTKDWAVEGTEAMRSRDFAAADSLFAGAGGWEGARPGQLDLNRGLAQASQGKAEDALRSFQRATAASDDPVLKADAWNNVGNVLLGGEDAEGAIQAYQQALRLDPSDADTRYNLSLAYAMRQEQQEQEQNQEQQDGEQDQQQDGEQDQQQDGEQDGEQDQQQDGEQDQRQDGEQDQQQDGEQDQQQESEQDQQQEPSPKPTEGQIQPEEAQRILDLLERNEAALRAKLQAQENAKRQKANRQKIEKDW